MSSVREQTMAGTRRTFLRGSAAGLAGAACARRLMGAEAASAAPARKIRIAARQGCFSGSFEAAKRCGLDGIELGVGGAAKKLSIANPAARRKHKEQVKATGVVVSSLSMDLLNGNPMATDPQAPAWLAQTIEAAGDLGAVGILVPFFGKGGLLRGRQLKKADVDALVGRMKEVAPKAKAAGVVLGLENTCSAKQNLAILDRIASDAVGCYYDIGNSTGAGYDVPAEIRQLKGRLCMIHFKDGRHYLGEGEVKMEPVAEALQAIGYEGWIVLETSCPSKDRDADCKRNVAFVRKLMGLPA
jgi:sugar phosphate isomerase/epimerase